MLDSIPIMRPFLGEAEKIAAADVIATGWIAQGPRVAEFERALSERVHAARGVALSSCTAGLHLAMVVLDLKAPDEVVVPSLSFIATANAARYVGATPVFADVDITTQNLSPETIERVLSPRTRAVLLVHQAGLPADIRSVHELCDPLGIAVIEDAACAIGATYRQSPVGSHSDLVAFSFHPRKIITTGEGGMLMTTREDWADRLCRLRQHGMNVSASDRHISSVPLIERYLESGYNYRMTDVQAAIGLVQLDRLDTIVARRRELAARYQDALAQVPGLSVMGDPPYGTTNYQSFWIVLPSDFPVSRFDLLQLMMSKGIAPRRGIMASHREPAFAGHAHIDLPVTELLTDRSLLLPLYHEMTESDQARVVDTLLDAAAGTSGGRPSNRPPRRER